MTNVLFVNDNLRLPAGITMVIKNIIDNCDSSDICFSILTIQSERNNALEYFQRKGVRVYYMPGATSTSSTSRWRNKIANLNVLSLLSLKRFFKHFFNENNFDIVHSHFAQIDKMMFPIAKNHGVRCCISHSHSSKLADTWIKALRNRVMCRGLLKLADYCAACSDSAGVALFGSSFLNSPKRMIIKNGISLANFVFDEGKRNKLRNEYGIPDGTYVIGNVGRLNRVKNQSFLIEVLYELVKNNKKNYILMLVGNGECESELKQKAKTLGLDDYVIFAGAQNGISSYLSAFDIFVMPSLHEGLGLAAVEAQANGLECILSTSIPEEVNMTNLQYMDLKLSPSIWADSIDSMPKKHHKDYNVIIQKNGYEIKDVCKELSAFYIEKSKL